MKKKLIVFTDLDGTFLDHDTYSCRESMEGLRILKERDCPLVLVSSKTRVEMEALHRELELDSPFIFENGGGIAGRDGPGYRAEMQGNMDPAALSSGLRRLRELTGGVIAPITEMATGELARRTGLTLEKAEMARKRETSVPFLLPGGAEIDIDDINEKIAPDGFKITRGGRFYHLIALDVDKGKAVEKIRRRYESLYNCPIVTAGVGDALNDIPMLLSVDRPFIVRKKDGKYFRASINGVIVTDGAGPAGFTEAVRGLIRELYNGGD